MGRAIYYNGGWEALDAGTLDGVDSTGYQKAIVKGTGSLPTTGWVANTGDYALKYNFAISGVADTDVIHVSIDKDGVDVVSDCELCPSNESYNGGVTFFAQTAPASAVSFSYQVVK